MRPNITEDYLICSPDGSTFAAEWQVMVLCGFLQYGVGAFAIFGGVLQLFFIRIAKFVATQELEHIKTTKGRFINQLAPEHVKDRINTIVKDSAYAVVAGFCTGMCLLLGFPLRAMQDSWTGVACLFLQTMCTTMSACAAHSIELVIRKKQNALKFVRGARIEVLLEDKLTDTFFLVLVPFVAAGFLIYALTNRSDIGAWITFVRAQYYITAVVYSATGLRVVQKKIQVSLGIAKVAHIRQGRQDSRVPKSAVQAVRDSVYLGLECVLFFTCCIVTATYALYPRSLLISVTVYTIAIVFHGLFFMRARHARIARWSRKTAAQKKARQIVRTKSFKSGIQRVADTEESRD